MIQSELKPLKVCEQGWVSLNVTNTCILFLFSYGGREWGTDCKVAWYTMKKHQKVLKLNNSKKKKHLVYSLSSLRINHVSKL